MIITKNDGSNINRVYIIVFKKGEIEAWIQGETNPITISMSDVSTVS